jgi:hypothetical protein
MFKTKGIVKSPEEFVWFANGQGMLEDDLLGDRIQKENYPCPRDYELVWFDNSETNIEIFPDEQIEPELEKQMKKVFESHTNMLI